MAISWALVDHVVVLSSCWRAINLEWKRRRYNEQNCGQPGNQLCTNRSESVSNEFLENRAANPRDCLRDEDEDEDRDQQGHDEGGWQDVPTRFRDVCDDRLLLLILWYNRRASADPA